MTMSAPRPPPRTSRPRTTATGTGWGLPTRSWAAPVEAAGCRARRAVELAEEELGRSGVFVGDGNPRRVQLVAVRVALAHEIADDLDAGGADRDVRRRRAPRPPE